MHLKKKSTHVCASMVESGSTMLTVVFRTTFEKVVFSYQKKKKKAMEDAHQQNKKKSLLFLVLLWFFLFLTVPSV